MSAEAGVDYPAEPVVTFPDSTAVKYRLVGLVRKQTDSTYLACARTHRNRFRYFDEQSGISSAEFAESWEGFVMFVYRRVPLPGVRAAQQ